MILVVTNPTGRSRTHHQDDGRTGWKRHAVSSAADAREPALCGLRPAAGWTIDLYQDRMPVCLRCKKAIDTVAQ